MGFSLRRALAGAVAGGAGAAVQLADNAIKAAEHDRQQADAFERQKELLRIHDENAIAREQRSFEFKEKYAAKKIERYSTFLSATTAELKKEGIKPESADGQARIAAALSSNGFPAEGDKYQDNYFKLMELKSKDTLARAEQGIRLEMARDRRAGSTDKESAKVAEKRLAETIDGFSFETRERDGKKGEPDNRAVDEVKRIVDRERRAGASVDDINSGLVKLKPAFNDERSKNPSAPGDEIFRSAWAQVVANDKPKDQAAPPKPTVVAPEPEKKRIPGVPEKLFGGPDSVPASTRQFQTSSDKPPPPPPQRSVAGIPISDIPLTGTKPMGRTVVDDIGDGLNTLTGGGNAASWNQVGGDIGKPRSVR